MLSSLGVLVHLGGMRTVFWMVWAAWAAGAALAAETRNATRASLLLGADALRPGQSMLIGVRLQMEPKWHTYWRNSGDSGQPTTIEWTLPAGLKAGPIEWPAPEKLTVEDITTYIYSGEVVLLVPLAVEASATPGEKEIVAKVSWLECEVNCVPGEATVRGKLTVGPETKPSANVALLKTWKIPRPDPRLQARAWWEPTAKADTRDLLLEWSAVTPGAEGDFYPYESDRIEVAAKTERLASQAGQVRLRKSVKKSSGDWPKEVAGLAMEKAGVAAAQAYEVRLMVSDATSVPSPSRATGPAPSVPAPGKAQTPAVPLWLMVGLAFLGGLILNVMPCVLPVIALKILGFVNQSREAPRRVRQLGIVYGLGVLASFLVLAGVVIGVQLAGRKASWGMQFGNPVFVVALTVLVTLVALNLFGLFEVTLGSGTLSAAAKLAGREGSAGAFFNGVLATALATPCTAPFLGTALGVALFQPPVIIVLVFLTVGAGLALPYVVLSFAPAWLKLLPKPGPWMEKFKVAMGFPMLGTAVWRCSIAQAHYGKHVWWLGVFLVLLALSAWIFGEFVQRGRKRRGLAACVAAALLIGGYAYALEDQLRWRAPAETASSRELQESPEGIPWLAWSPQAVQKARAEGRPVFVDFTADWCVTCQANKKTSIEIPSVRARLKEIKAVSLLGDYTKVPPAMTDELNRFGRAGVPLVLVYPRNSSAPPLVLPELLTPSLVLHALDKAAE